MSKLKIGRHISRPSETSTNLRLFCHSWPLCIVINHWIDIFMFEHSTLITLRCVCIVHRGYNFDSSVILNTSCKRVLFELTSATNEKIQVDAFFAYRPRYRSTFETRSTWEKAAREWIHAGFSLGNFIEEFPEWRTETTPLTGCDASCFSAHTYRRCRISRRGNIFVFWMKINLSEISWNFTARFMPDDKRGWRIYWL